MSRLSEKLFESSMQKLVGAFGGDFEKFSQKAGLNYWRLLNPFPDAIFSRAVSIILEQDFLKLPAPAVIYRQCKELQRGFRETNLSDDEWEDRRRRIEAGIEELQAIPDAWMTEARKSRLANFRDILLREYRHDQI